jgi:hypothetical protein
LLLNLFFLADISFTLIDRILKKKSIFKRHNDFVFKKIIFKYGPKKYFLTAFIFQILMVSGSILMVIF